jgi:hypothetical protein
VFGVVTEATTRALLIPVLKPREDMVDDALSRGERIAHAGHVRPERVIDGRRVRRDCRGPWVEARIPHRLHSRSDADVSRGRGDKHNRLLADAAPAFGDCDALLFAHFSTSRAFETVHAREDSGPDQSAQLRARAACGDRAKVMAAHVSASCEMATGLATALLSSLSPGATDCHVYVFDPARFPFAAYAPYHPVPAECGTAHDLRRRSMRVASGAWC